MEEITTKTELLRRVVEGRAALEALLEPIPAEQMLVSGVEADWSLKDILAHIAAWEDKMTAVFAAVQSSDATPDWPTTDAAVDQLNADFYAANRDKPLDQVQQEFAAAYPQAYAAVRAMPEADLFDSERYPWREGRPLWYLVGGNTFWHYEEHIPNIKAWLSQ